ncbi:MAG TPA: Hpt domain-containing protein [Candidatus Wunengus sp. YC60]|uniref:Hpt domain-containing protein n=1 Tax=Candidatus Wunengus sp. YC60 TaxID=3367697 RepID=UPI004029501A
MTYDKEKIVVHIDPDLKNLIPGFLQHKRDDIKTILEALAKNDYETVRVLGHSMKGAGAGYGFDAISTIGLSIEQAAKGKNSLEIQKQVDKLTTYLGCVEIIYE